MLGVAGCLESETMQHQARRASELIPPYFSKRGFVWLNPITYTAAPRGMRLNVQFVLREVDGSVVGKLVKNIIYIYIYSGTIILFTSRHSWRILQIKKNSTLDAQTFFSVGDAAESDAGRFWPPPLLAPAFFVGLKKFMMEDMAWWQVYADPVVTVFTRIFNLNGNCN